MGSNSEMAEDDQGKTGIAVWKMALRARAYCPHCSRGRHAESPLACFRREFHTVTLIRVICDEIPGVKFCMPLLLLLSYDSPRGGITVVTEHGPTSTSRLLIQKATLSDAGRYTCRPANADPHFLTVHIIHNEHPAAIHHKNGTSSAAGVHQRASSSHSLSLMLLMLVLITACNVLPSENYKACQVVSRGSGGGGGGMPNASGDKHRSSEGFRRRGLSPNGSRERPFSFDLRASSGFPGESREAGRRGRPFVAPLGRGGSDLRVRCCNGLASALGDGHRSRSNLSCELGRFLHGLRRHGDSCHDSRRHASSCETSCSPSEASVVSRFRDRPLCPPRRHPDALIDHSIRSDVSSALTPSSRGPHDHIVPSAPRRPRGRPAEGALSPEVARAGGVAPSPGESRARALRCEVKRGNSPPPLSARVGVNGEMEASVSSLA
ncbi:uncharacterized protein LOC125041078 [Penaeus chinensis]|uniref:uncharacterized protein LOC125041078 n=1 Tax=Penaeus chinensis TaxID=139456 RepID=UPI001FB5D7E6|nr:uncharacterized protein LOC125041078 [Penaeus chinensis]